MPVYNAQAFCARTLKSLMAQTYRDIEIIAVNDGSTDGSRAICERLAQRDSRIRVLSGENVGASLARKKGLAFASGEYFMFCDADDLLVPEAVQTMVAAAEESAANIALFGYTGFLFHPKFPLFRWTPHYACFDRPGVHDGQDFIDQHFNSFFGWGTIPVGAPGYFYRRDFFDAVNPEFPAHSFGEDLCLNIQLLPKVGRVMVVPQPLYLYRLGGSSARFNPNYISDQAEIKQYQLRALQQQGARMKEYLFLYHLEAATALSAMGRMAFYYKTKDPTAVASLMREAFEVYTFLQEAQIYLAAHPERIETMRGQWGYERCRLFTAGDFEGIALLLQSEIAREHPLKPLMRKLRKWLR
jgi:glycosyltransferase involved in cell wall biosynthesis